MASIARVLEGAGHATFLPQRDGLEVLAMRLATLPLARSAALGFADRLVRRAIFSVDVFQLVEGCDAIVCNLNGRVPDEGAVVEATLAYATGNFCPARQSASAAQVIAHSPLIPAGSANVAA